MENTLDGYTTFNQAMWLFNSGLDPNTADLCYDLGSDPNDPSIIICPFKDVYDEYDLPDGDAIPCWTLGRLLSLFPEKIRIPEQVSPNPLILVVYPKKEIRYENGFDDILEFGDNLMESAVKIALFLYAHNYLPKQENIQEK